MRVCGRCKLERDENHFGVRDRRTGRRHTICLVCRREYWRNCYYRDTTEINARRRVRLRGYRARNRTMIQDYFLTHPCVDCGLVDPLVMEFDHVRGRKRADVSVLVRQAAPVSTILSEIAKCVVRCANCHRRRTAVSLWGRTPFVKEGFIPDSV